MGDEDEVVPEPATHDPSLENVVPWSTCEELLDRIDHLAPYDNLDDPVWDLLIWARKHFGRR